MRLAWSIRLLLGRQSSFPLEGDVEPVPKTRELIVLLSKHPPVPIENYVVERPHASEQRQTLARKRLTKVRSRYRPFSLRCQVGQRRSPPILASTRHQLANL